MIVEPSEPGSPVHERSPLKQKETQLQRATSPLEQSAPPPPYAGPSTQAIPPAYNPPPQPVVIVQSYGESTLKRLLKAYIVALLIIFLWGVFIDTIDMLAHRGHRNRRYLASTVKSFLV